MRAIPAMRSDPELEVHSIVEDSDRHVTVHENKFYNDEISVVNKKSTVKAFTIDHEKTSHSMQPAKGCEEISLEATFDDYGYPMDIIGDGNDFATIDLGYILTWSDDIDEEPLIRESAIYDSIRKARKRMNAEIAVEKAGTLQQETKSLRCDIQRQISEIAELNALLQIKDDQIGILEQERDLSKADTIHIANELESCLIKLRRVGGTSSPVSIGFGKSDADDNNAPERQNTDECLVGEKSENIPSLPNKKIVVDSAQPSVSSREVDKPNSEVSHMEISPSPSTTSGTDSSTTTFSTRSSQIAAIAAPSSTNSITSARILPVVEKPRLKSKQSTQQLHPKKGLLHQPKAPTRLQQEQQRCNTNAFSFQWCRPNASTSNVTKLDSTSKQNGREMSTTSNVHKTQAKQVATSEFEICTHFTDEEIQTICDKLHRQVHQLSQTLYSSTITSENLRRRIATLDSFYNKQLEGKDLLLNHPLAQEQQVASNNSISRNYQSQSSFVATGTTMNGLDGSKKLDETDNVPTPITNVPQQQRKSRVVTFVL